MLKKVSLVSLMWILPLAIVTGQTFAQTLADQYEVIDQSKQKIGVKEYFESIGHQMQLSPGTEMVFEKSMAGHNGYVHDKYQQTYKGIPVFGSVYSLHHKDDLVQYGTGQYIPNIHVNVIPSVSKYVAIESAKRKMGAKKYAWEEHEGHWHHVSKPDPTLVILDQAFPNVSPHQDLVYQVDLSSTKPLNAVRYFVDAQSGEVIHELPLIMDHAVPSKGKSKYYGEVDFISDSISPNEFLLHDLTRGDGINTTDSRGQTFKNDENYWDLTNEDQDEVAVDLHYCVTSFYDLMKNDFNWDGVDGLGKELRSVVLGDRQVNAFWNEKAFTAYFGGGDCNNGPLTTLEVVGHEFMHGVTQFGAGLVYRGESGAINESMSDVFGKALEYFVDPTGFDWWIGESFKLNDYTRPFRSMEDPSIFNHPDYYRGANWNANAGVHTNSSVGNHWFYNLVTGQSGTTEKGENYDIEALSMEKVLQIAFLSLTGYMGRTSDYNFYYESSLLAARELFGANSPEEESVKEAWKSVGLPNSDFKMVVYFEEGNRISSCIKDDFYSFNLVVFNPSDHIYQPSMGGRLIVEGMEYATLDDPILPGGSQTFVVDDAVYFSGYERNTINVDLRVTDPNVYHHTYQYVINSIDVDTEMAIRISPTYGYKCFEEERTTTLSIYTNSCNDVPKGTPFTVKFTNLNNNNVWARNYETSADLNSINSYSFTETFPLSQTENTSIEIELTFPGDPDLSNNKLVFTHDPINIVSNNYHQDFTTLKDDTLIQTQGFVAGLKEYQSEWYLATSGYFQDGEINQLCPEAEESIGGFSDNNFLLCVDLENMPSPELTFDLTQFRNKRGIDYPELHDNTTVFKLVVEDENVVLEENIYGLTVGDQESFNYDLPSSFKGQIELKFFNLTGKFNFPDYLDYDVTFMDNLFLGDLSVGNKDLSFDDVLTVSPNPSDGVFIIKHGLNPVEIRVNDISGKQVLFQNSNFENLDLTDQTAGTYIMTTVYESGEIRTARLVVHAQ